jgi:hypothetical protein
MEEFEIMDQLFDWSDLDGKALLIIAEKTELKKRNFTFGN